jgi:hypothetical protein
MQLEVCRAKRHRTTTPEALEIAFGQYIIKQGFTQLLRNRDIALRSEVSTKLVRRINTSVAVAGLRRQLELLGCMVACARNERPEFVLTRLTWDETGERVQLNADCGGAVSSTWQAPCPCQAISVIVASTGRASRRRHCHQSACIAVSLSLSTVTAHTGAVARPIVHRFIVVVVAITNRSWYPGFPSS